MRGNKTSIRRLNVCQKKRLITGNRRQKQQNGGGTEGRGGRANLPCGEVFFVYVVYFFQGIQANVPSLSRVRWSISSQRVAANAVAIPHPSLGPLGRNLKKVFHSSSEARNHSCKELHGLSVFHFHFKLGLYARHNDLCDVFAALCIDAGLAVDRIGNRLTRLTG